MTIQIGHFGLIAAALLGVLVIVLSLAAGRFNNASQYLIARRLFVLFAAVLTLVSAAFMTAMLTSDFRIKAVVDYTELALPTGYKMAAFWAGQDGSVLLWAWMLAVISVVAAFIHRGQSLAEKSYSLTGLAVFCVFLVTLLLFAKNPFRTVDILPADGNGLNPQLQDPAMLAHPPILFLGYAGYTIPFALMIGALLANRRDNDWLAPIRAWSIFAWIALTIGIVWGAEWAYVELGWGGYWAWDPVENASLLPWLTGTALMHTLVVHVQRGMLKKTNAALISVTALLCIFATYLTRSGVVQSVHAFQASIIATFFLVFLAILLVAMVLLIVVKRKLLTSEHPLESLLSRDFILLITAVLLMIMTGVTLVGTMFPVISGWFLNEGITLKRSFFDITVGPAGLLLALLMALGPLLSYGKDAGAKLIKGLAIAGPIAVLLAVAFAVKFNIRNPWALICAFTAFLSVAVMLQDLIRSILARAKASGENLALAAFRLIDHNHHRYGGHIVHLGVMVLIIGVTASSLFVEEHRPTMSAGQSDEIAGFKINFDKVEYVKGPNFEAYRATVTWTGPEGQGGTLFPEIRGYAKSRNPSAEAAIVHTSRGDDLYIALLGVDNIDRAGVQPTVALRILISPLVNWIWIGAITMTLGGLFAMLPRLEPKPADAVPVETPVEPLAERLTHQPRFESTGNGKHSIKRKARR